MSAACRLAAVSAVVWAGAAAAQPPPAATTPPAATPVAPRSPDEETARRLFQEGKIEEAAETFKRAGRANPALPPAWAMIATLCYEAKQGQAARQALERAATDDPTHPEIFLINGNWALLEGRVTDLVLSCQAALSYAESPRWDATQRKRYVREARLGLATGYEGRRNYNAAREELSKLLADDPKNALLRYRVAVTKFMLEQQDEAFKDFQQAFKDDPTVDPPELAMAELWKRRGDAAKTEEWLRKAVTAHPQNPRCARQLANWLMEEQKHADAQGQIEAAVRLDPDSRDTRALRAFAARYKKDYDAAEQLFEGLARDFPSDRQVALNLPLVLTESPQPQKKQRAVELAQVVVQRYPQDGEAWAVLGWVLYRNGRLNDAQEALQKSISGGRMSLDTSYFLARVLTDRGRAEDAHRVLKEAVAARGGFVYRDDAKALLADLEKRLPKKSEEKK